MQYIVTGKQMKQLDKNTTSVFQVPGMVLMERAALSVCVELSKKVGTNASVLIVCGTGNNGGDGFAIARILHTRGYRVTCFLTGDTNSFSKDCAKQFEIVECYKIPVVSELPLGPFDVVIDAVFGIGLNRPLSQKDNRLFQSLNKMSGLKLAVDIPSGINADTGAVMGTAFIADLTVTFAFCKLGMLLAPGKNLCGSIIVTDIGITKESFCGELPSMFSYQKQDLITLPKRNIDGNKSTFGKLAIIAGNHEGSGACQLCSKSAYRSGAGYVRVLTSANNFEIMSLSLPEAVLHLYTAFNSQENTSLEKAFAETVIKSNVILAGPGIGTGEQSVAIIKLLMETEQKPLILDADALNIIAFHSFFEDQLIKRTKKSCNVVLTPHILEFARLLHKDIEEVKEHRLDLALTYAKEHQVVLVCKDSVTMVVSPDGQIYINQSGNESMATAGSGDVLSGMIASFVGQSMPLFEASCLAVYVHGLCGDYAKSQTNSYYVTASDLIDALKFILK